MTVAVTHSDQDPLVPEVDVGDGETITSHATLTDDQEYTTRTKLSKKVFLVTKYVDGVYTFKIHNSKKKAVTFRNWHDIDDLRKNIDRFFDEGDHETVFTSKKNKSAHFTIIQTIPAYYCRCPMSDGHDDSKCDRFRIAFDFSSSRKKPIISISKVSGDHEEIVEERVELDISDGKKLRKILPDIACEAQFCFEILAALHKMLE